MYRVTPNFGKLLLEIILCKVQYSACKKLAHTGLFSTGKAHSVEVVSTLPDTMQRPCVFLNLLLKHLQMQIKYFLCLLVIVFLIYTSSYKEKICLNKYDNFIPEPIAHTHNLAQ